MDILLKGLSSMDINDAACAYCGMSDPKALVFCKRTKKWFCNGRLSDGNNVNKKAQSHIIAHLLYSSSNEVRLHKDGLSSDVTLRCSSCTVRNVFELGYSVSTSKSVERLICRNCDMRRHKQLFNLSYQWLPINSDDQIASWLVEIPSDDTMQSTKRITGKEMYALERTWKDNTEATLETIDRSQINADENIAKVPLPVTFQDHEQYKAFMLRLLEMEAVHERYLCASLKLHDVAIEWEERETERRYAFFKYPDERNGICKNVLLGDEMIIRKQSDDMDKWEAFGKVMTISKDDGRIRLLIKQILGGDIPDALASERYEIEIKWRANTHNRRTNAVIKIGEGSCDLLPPYFLQHLLGRRLVETLHPFHPPSCYSAPHLSILNDHQVRSIKHALAYQFTMILGPPGTGKTLTAATIVYHMVQQQKMRDSKTASSQGKILVVTPSNVACDELCHRIQLTGVNVVRMYALSMEQEITPDSRVYSSAVHVLAKRNTETAVQTNGGVCALVDELIDQHVFRAKCQRDNQVMANADVICCTCVAAADRRLVALPFRAVLIDEAAQAIEPDCLIPLTNGCQQFIMIGDHNQLGPVVMSQKAAKAGLSRTMFDRYFLLEVEPSRLLIQYRMHPALAVFPNKTFYGGSLQNGVKVKDRLPVSSFPWPCDKTPMVLYRLKGSQERGSSGVSFINQVEVKHLTTLVGKLINAGVSATDIGVITPYAAQRDHILRFFSGCSNLGDRLTGVEVNTIDGFQGREKEYILISCVRSAGNPGFFTDRRRINVSLTRARRGLIIVADESILSSTSILGELAEFFRNLKLIVE